MIYSLDSQQCKNLSFSSKREWLLPNGIGGFAMGTAGGINTRRYHGLLVASIHPPTDRRLLLAGIDGWGSWGSTRLALSANQYPGAVHPDGFDFLESFTVSDRAIWIYRRGQVKIRKTVYIVPGENTVLVEYQNLGTKLTEISLTPLVCHRDFHANFAERESYPQSIQIGSDQTVIEEDGVELVLSHPGAMRSPVAGWYYRFEHEREIERGLDPRDDLFCPCELTYSLGAGESAAIAASIGEPSIQTIPEATDSAGIALSKRLSEAASKFLVKTAVRTTILAGYPWFSDWGRDTMIAVPGICLQTGHEGAARNILRDYASQMRNGLIPNRFVEKGEIPDYNTVDATLWFANAIYKTLLKEWDEPFGQEMLKALDQVIWHHRHGTDFGIIVDPSDGLLKQGGEGLQLTWMDAKIGDWVVTPRHGKPIEINGLWINLLRITCWLKAKLGQSWSAEETMANLATQNFESKFWHEARGHYFDTIEPGDASLRPNQVIAMSLPFSPCDIGHSKRALEVVERELLTPVGLRTLGPNEPGYEGRFEGPMKQLDAAYHQGTVWPWLMGPYISAKARTGADVIQLRKIMKNAVEMLSESGLGGISECYDGDAPHRPNGCPWQAWSVAEYLRAWNEDCGGD